MQKLKFIATLVAALLAFNNYALDSVNKSIWSSVAIDGYDPVAYFKEGKPVKGQKSFTLNIKQGKYKAKWRFASEENKQLFQKNPDKYAPQYGGYCAYAVAHNSTADIDPEAWAIVDGKLYLNYNQDIQKKWQQQQQSFIEKADSHWPKLLE